MRIPLILLLLTASPAWAEVCDKERPGWSPTDGTATGLDELVFLFTSLPGFGILGALTLALLTRQKRYWAIAAMFSGVIALALALNQASPDAISAAAIAEGCVGSQAVTVAICAGIAGLSLAVLAVLWLRNSPAARI